MTRTQRPKPKSFVPAGLPSRNAVHRAARNAASQTIEDCANILGTTCYIDRAMYPSKEGFEDDPFEQIAAAISRRIELIEDRCLTLIEAALAVIERDSSPDAFRDCPCAADADRPAVPDADGVLRDVDPDAIADARQEVAQ